MPVPRRHAADETDHPYFISMADMLAGVLFIFIILMAYFALAADFQQFAGTERERTRLEAEVGRLDAERGELAGRIEAALTNSDRVRAELLERLRARASAAGLALEVDEANGVLRVPESLLFNAGEARLRPDGREALAVLARVLAEELAREGVAAQRLESVFIEGHADNTPIRTAQFPDNWALSTARAKNTCQEMFRQSPALERLANGRGQPLIGVAGYGDLRPVAGNETAEGRAVNRRIDIRIALRAPEDFLRQPSGAAGGGGMR